MAGTRKKFKAGSRKEEDILSWKGERKEFKEHPLSEEPLEMRDTRCKEERERSEE